MAGFLKELGLFKAKKESNVEKEQTLKVDNNIKVKKEKTIITPEECLYDKSYVCPVCNNSFKARCVRKNKARFISNDDDLKPNYEPIHPDYYDVIMCDMCGYAAISQNFEKISQKQVELIEENIKPNFQRKEYPLVYDSRLALERYEIALLNCEAKRAKMGEKSFIHLKMAWIYRDIGNKDSEILELKTAYEGFNNAILNEKFPICGTEENTLLYIVAAIAERLGYIDEAKRIIGSLIIKKNLGERLKKKIEDFRERIKNIEE